MSAALVRSRWRSTTGGGRGIYRTQEGGGGFRILRQQWSVGDTRRSVPDHTIGRSGTLLRVSRRSHHRLREAFPLGPPALHDERAFVVEPVDLGVVVDDARWDPAFLAGRADAEDRLRALADAADALERDGAFAVAAVAVVVSGWHYGFHVLRSGPSDTLPHSPGTIQPDRD